VVVVVVMPSYLADIVKELCRIQEVVVVLS
jgi:hypothetical protein